MERRGIPVFGLLVAALCSLSASSATITDTAECAPASSSEEEWIVISWHRAQEAGIGNLCLLNHDLQTRSMLGAKPASCLKLTAAEVPQPYDRDRIAADQQSAAARAIILRKGMFGAGAFGTWYTGRLVQGSWPIQEEASEAWRLYRWAHLISSRSLVSWKLINATDAEAAYGFYPDDPIVRMHWRHVRLAFYSAVIFFGIIPS